MSGTGDSRRGPLRIREAVLLAVLALCGCARDRIHVSPVSLDLDAKNPGKLICIVENPRVVVSDFLGSYRAALEDKGYKVNVVKRNPQVSACPLTTRYVAYANGFARLEVYWEGIPAGMAAHSAAANSEEALRQLVNRLLP